MKNGAANCRAIVLERAALRIVPICGAVFGIALANAAEVAERPDWKVGDRWVFHAKSEPPPSESDWSREVKEALADGMFRVATETGRMLTFDEEGNSLDRRGSDYSWRRFNFPLTVGKRWDHKYKIERQNAQGSATSSWEVKAFERISVPAGTFDCYKVEGREYQNWTPLNMPGGAWIGQGFTLTEYWYCPAIRWVAKWHINDRSWLQAPHVTYVSELTSYSLTP
jgi:hypothetical protein